jgi:hypothetical protein
VNFWKFAKDKLFKICQLKLKRDCLLTPSDVCQEDRLSFIAEMREPIFVEMESSFHGRSAT